jgi:predicted DNA-binding antitoxin AbrB/MazE fold protein
MPQVEAIYQEGVFKPLGQVGLPDSQRVLLTIQPLEARDIRAWLDSVQELHRQITDQCGVLPDSTLDIAADRLR